MDWTGMTLVDLEVNQGSERFGHVVSWPESPPFVINPRGVLAHRVRHADTHTRNGKSSHYGIDFWCGNVTCIGLEQEHALLDHTDGRILCARCEAIAVANGEPSADELVGHHVHIGGVRAYRTCCTDEGN